MAHVFDAKKMAKLDDPRRKDLIPVDKILQTLGLQEGERVLDLGCGIGFLTLPAARVVGAAGFVYGLDIQEDMLVEALSRSRKEGLSNIAWVLTPPDKVSLPAASVDYVTMGLVAHEAPDLGVMLKECHRVLKPGGRVGIIEWNDTFTEMGPPPEHRLKQDVLISKLKEHDFSKMSLTDLSQGTYMVVGKKGE
ncbi:class I SAM-dependent methyltransferase [Desulfotomaculum nigrificans]|uniref:class I SAM-dependent methyltransferase n=1 Tax=Desulfotomaculum nigrificans TaxID=1565 RepID=UPI0001FADF0A|nr:class I SAM-dependent methyltransferase [Desulfotomaculum nigrificans]